MRDELTDRHLSSRATGPLRRAKICDILPPTYMSKIAVIATGGKQYVVSLGDVFEIEKLEGVTKVGEKIVFNDVLLTDDGAKTAVGVPTVTGASVEAELVEEGRGDKITVVRYKAKSRYHKKRGHRQPFTKVKITKIA